MKHKQTIFRLTLPSNPKYIGRVEPYLMKINACTPLDEIKMHKLMVSVTEAVNNAMIHGNKKSGTKKVRVISEILPGWLVVMIDDEGKGFRPDTLHNPLKEDNIMKESGRGVFLMRTLMDKVEFEVTKEGMEVRLWLDLNK